MRLRDVAGLGRALAALLTLLVGTGFGLAIGWVMFSPAPVVEPPPVVAPEPAPPPSPPPPPEKLALSPAAFADLPGWTEDAQEAALVALKRSCARKLRLRADRPLTPEIDGVAFGTSAAWRIACAEVAMFLPGEAAGVRDWLEHRFRPWRVSGREGAQGLFTGYYEAELRGARTPSEVFRHPVYRRPADLIQVDLGLFSERLKGRRITGRVDGFALKPYWTRAEIEAGALVGKGLEILWTDSAVDVFFLHIQGSGRVTLDDGAVVRVGYEAQNGRDYLPVGRALIERGALPRENVTMQSIRAWLADHADEADAVMNLNPSYVFFRELPPARDGADGPLGAEGVPLTPERSLAVDRAFLPMGLLLWLDLAHADAADGVVRRLVVAQDTGGAIKGPVRGDFFWGHGPRAYDMSGRMKARGGYWALIPVE
jgi:membrane-bound lytic murein transglycosylase A